MHDGYELVPQLGTSPERLRQWVGQAQRLVDAEPPSTRRLQSVTRVRGVGHAHGARLAQAGVADLHKLALLNDVQQRGLLPDLGNVTEERLRGWVEQAQQLVGLWPQPEGVHDGYELQAVLGGRGLRVLWGPEQVAAVAEQLRVTGDVEAWPRGQYMSVALYDAWGAPIALGRYAASQAMRWALDNVVEAHNARPAAGVRQTFTEVVGPLRRRARRSALLAASTNAADVLAERVARLREGAFPGAGPGRASEGGDGIGLRTVLCGQGRGGCEVLLGSTAQKGAGVTCRHPVPRVANVRVTSSVPRVSVCAWRSGTDGHTVRPGRACRWPPFCLHVNVGMGGCGCTCLYLCATCIERLDPWCSG